MLGVVTVFAALGTTSSAPGVGRTVLVAITGPALPSGGPGLLRVYSNSRPEGDVIATQGDAVFARWSPDGHWLAVLSIVDGPAESDSRLVLQILRRPFFRGASQAFKIESFHPTQSGRRTRPS